MGELKKAGQIWKEFEDYLAPLLGMKPGERSVYSYLVRHTRLEGRRGVVVGMAALARGVGLGYAAARWHLFRLARKGCVQVRPYRHAQAIEVFLPEEVIREIRVRDWERLQRDTVRVSKNRVLRAAILRRERGRCFYCQQRLVEGKIWFDHVVPLARGGSPEEKNVVACCRTCNRWKGTGGAEAFLRELCKARGISKEQLQKRLAAIREILRGKLRLRRAA
ncbi:MAG: HNH endonuclease [Acidobacteria bacterium]|nr:HNH endonuclease [Acidobacteriota bacterium]